MESEQQSQPVSEVAPPTTEGEEPGQVQPLPPAFTMGAASFTTQQQENPLQGRTGRGGGGRQLYHPGRGSVRGGGRGKGRGPPTTAPPTQQQQHSGRGGPGPVSIAPTTGIPFGHIPAYLPGSSSLVEELNTRMLVVLRDGRHLVGVSAN